MKDDWAERSTALRAGETFRVLADARSFPPPHFKVGEELTLQSIEYSRYDSAYVYMFEGEGSVQKAYWLHDDEPLERLTSVFESGHA